MINKRLLDQMNFRSEVHVSSLILGASKPEQLRENAKACENINLLTDEVMNRIAAMAASLS